jgi:hypothetical protein
MVLLPSLVLANEVESNLSVYGQENAKGYMLPIRDALSAGLSGGLYYSAHIPQEKFYARIEFQAQRISFGDDDRTFRATTEDYFPDPTSVDAPTVVGTEQSITVDDPVSGASFTFPGGLNIGALALGVPQLRLGGLQGTEALVRWLAVDIGDSDLGELDMFGFGIRHSISQYLEQAPLDMAGMVQYQSMKVGSNDILDSSLWNLGVHGSRRFGVLEPYGGLGLDIFSLKLKYDQTVGQESRPITVEYGAKTSVHATLGLGLNVAIFHANAELNLAEKTTWGIGLSIGN